jgi:hypothetical protein
MTCKGHLNIFLSSIEGTKLCGQRETDYPFNLHFPDHIRSSVGFGIASIGGDGGFAAEDKRLQGWSGVMKM